MFGGGREWIGGVLIAVEVGVELSLFDNRLRSQSDGALEGREWSSPDEMAMKVEGGISYYIIARALTTSYDAVWKSWRG